MQKVNGADAVHETYTSVAPHSAVVTDPKVLPADVLEKLKAPLPPEAVSPNPDKPGLSVIKVIYVVERLNDVLDSTVGASSIRLSKVDGWSS